ncbi:MAG: lipid-A-disaccharide synthase [Bacteroidota bacterium]|nr:lipid-A-disaccharide synthase [Bacteroidota bacterium]
MKYYIIAGEASGDLHGSNLMKELIHKDPTSDFRYWGGDLMAAHGGTQVMHYKDTAYMGFFEVFVHLPDIFKNIRNCKKDILNYKPNALILIDYPGFNLRIAKFAKENNIKVYYYISPKVWAWKKSRIKKLKAFTDKLLVIFPFEPEFFKSHGMSVDFVGNPLLDEIVPILKTQSSREVFCNENGLDTRPIVALLPGSRKSEIKHNFPAMVKLSEEFADFQFVVAKAPSLSAELFEKYIGDRPIHMVDNKTYKLLSHAKAAVVTSGTATLETAFFGVPEFVCYRGDAVSFEIAKRLVDVKYISLVNLIADELVIKELIQYDMTGKNLKDELHQLLFDQDYIEKMKQAFIAVKEKSGGQGASARAAELISDSLK